MLMQEHLLSPRQLSSSNYLLWVPPRVKLSLGFVFWTSSDLSEESSAVNLASPGSVHHLEGLCLADLHLDRCQQKGSAEGTEAAKGPSAWAPEQPGIHLG